MADYDTSVDSETSVFFGSPSSPEKRREARLASKLSIVDKGKRRQTELVPNPSRSGKENNYEPLIDLLSSNSPVKGKVSYNTAHRGLWSNSPLRISSSPLRNSIDPSQRRLSNTTPRFVADGAHHQSPVIDSLASSSTSLNPCRTVSQAGLRYSPAPGRLSSLRPATTSTANLDKSASNSEVDSLESDDTDSEDDREPDSEQQTDASDSEDDVSPDDLLIVSNEAGSINPSVIADDVPQADVHRAIVVEPKQVVNLKEATMNEMDYWTRNDVPDTQLDVSTILYESQPEATLEVDHRFPSAYESLEIDQRLAMIAEIALADQLDHVVPESGHPTDNATEDEPVAIGGLTLDDILEGYPSDDETASVHVSSEDSGLNKRNAQDALGGRDADENAVSGAMERIQSQLKMDRQENHLTADGGEEIYTGVATELGKVEEITSQSESGVTIQAADENEIVPGSQVPVKAQDRIEKEEDISEPENLETNVGTTLVGQAALSFPSNGTRSPTSSTGSPSNVSSPAVSTTSSTPSASDRCFTQTSYHAPAANRQLSKLTSRIAKASGRPAVQTLPPSAGMMRHPTGSASVSLKRASPSHASTVLAQRNLIPPSSRTSSFSMAKPARIIGKVNSPSTAPNAADKPKQSVLKGQTALPSIKNLAFGKPSAGRVDVPRQPTIQRTASTASTASSDLSAEALSRARLLDRAPATSRPAEVSTFLGQRTSSTSAAQAISRRPAAALIQRPAFGGGRSVSSILAPVRHNVSSSFAGRPIQKRSASLLESGALHALNSQKGVSRPQPATIPSAMSLARGSALQRGETPSTEDLKSVGVTTTTSSFPAPLPRPIPTSLSGATRGQNELRSPPRRAQRAFSNNDRKGVSKRPAESLELRNQINKSDPRIPLEPTYRLPVTAAKPFSAGGVPPKVGPSTLVALSPTKQRPYSTLSPSLFQNSLPSTSDSQTSSAALSSLVAPAHAIQSVIGAELFSEKQDFFGGSGSAPQPLDTVGQTSFATTVVTTAGLDAASDSRNNRRSKSTNLEPLPRPTRKKLPPPIETVVENALSISEVGDEEMVDSRPAITFKPVPTLTQEELTQMTHKNTKKNRVHFNKLDIQTVFVPENRPPSPTSKIRRSLGNEGSIGRPTTKEGREARAAKRRSALRSSTDGSETALMDAELADEGAASISTANGVSTTEDCPSTKVHFRAAGDEEEYESPVRPAAKKGKKKSSVASGEKRRVKWDKSLVYEDPQPAPKMEVTSDPIIKRVSLGPFGNSTATGNGFAKPASVQIVIRVYKDDA